MIQLTPQMRILVAVEPVDFRKGIDGLSREVRQALSSDPFSGAVFVFRNRRRTAVKILAYDGQGYWLCQKRLSKGKFRHWPGIAGTASLELLAHELHVLLCGGDPDATGAAPVWRRLPSTKEGHSVFQQSLSCRDKQHGKAPVGEEARI